MEPSVTELGERGKAAKAASKKLASLSTGIKNKALTNTAEALIDRRDEILRGYAGQAYAIPGSPGRHGSRHKNSSGAA
jgi:hypothetical protein